MEIPGYEVVHPLMRSGPFALYRGLRASDRRPVLVKAIARRPPRPSDVEAVEREHRFLTELGGAAAPLPLDLVRAAEVVALVLSDEGLLPLRSLLRSAPLGLKAFFRLSVSLCRALGVLHERGIVHGTVNPASILTSAAFDRVQFVDFAASAHEGPGARGVAAGVLGESAPYMSPEQTGRINRQVDHRTDLYSLGATFYELLTGAPPFSSSDALELIHSHIARVPPPPSDVEPAIPQPLSQVVLRLLAKDASDRYQTAAGLAHDLERGETEWLAAGRIDPFELGTRDFSDRFLLPQKLYGREPQLAAITSAFDRACQGDSRLLLVSGPSGAGKTALVAELYRPIVRQGGKLVTGKFEQIVRDVPYGALARAFRSLVWQLLTESEDRLSSWRERLSHALASAGGAVLAEVIPEIEFIIGKQPAAPPVEPAEAQNRFRLAFQNFVGAVAEARHPLVVFLDDLQWADPASVDLLMELLASRDVRYTLFIGAYRDADVPPDHPLHPALTRLAASGIAVDRLALGPMSAEAIAEFLADTLHAPLDAVSPLADLVRQRTDANPLFVIQYLKALQQRGLFAFEPHRGRWGFRLEAITAADETGGVVDLMTAKIRGLSPAAQGLLTVAACLGSQFETPTLDAVAGLPPGGTTEALAEASEAGLLYMTAAPQALNDVQAPVRPTAAFVHDRVQQAAYALIPEDERPRRHLDIGTALLAGVGEPVPEERLFEIVNHLNIGVGLLLAPAQRDTTARLNLRAGRKAKLSAAYAAAAAYLDAGLVCLADSSWASSYDLAFALHLDAAECHYLAGHLDLAERRFEDLFAHAGSALDAAQVHSLRVVLHENLSQYDQAVASGRQGLALLDAQLPEAAPDVERALDQEIGAIDRLLGDRPIADLVELPVVADPRTRTVMRILTSLWAPAYLSGSQVLTRLISARMVHLSLLHGNTEDSAYGYVTHAITIGPIRRDYETAYQWGLLALRVNERFGDVRLRAKIHQQFQAHVNLWRRPLATCVPHAREARRSGLDAGDFTYAGYGAVTESWAAFLTSTSLDRFVRDHEPTLALLEKIRMRDFLTLQTIMLNWARALQGLTDGPASLSAEGFDEHAFVSAYERSAPVFLGFYYTARTHLLVLHEAFTPAIEAASRGRAVALEGTIWPVLLDFWGGLAITGAWPGLAQVEREAQAAALARSRASLDGLAAACPENFRCFSLLLAGETARISGQFADAARACEEAAAYAAQTGSLQAEALAHELAARARLAAGESRAAANHLSHARDRYSAWGAAAKVGQLSKSYGSLLNRHPGSTAATTDIPGTRDDGDGLADPSLDMATVLKLSRVIAGEVHLEGLLEKLIRITLESAGAERGVFLLDRDGELFVEARARADRDEVSLGPSIPMERADLPISVLRYVRRTGQALVLGDASADERFAADPFVAAEGLTSVLCVPVSQQGRLRGVLYLENRLTSDAFTAGRVELVRILAAQAAISLENARLYEDMKAEIGRRTDAEQKLRVALAEVEALKNRLEAENVYLQEEIQTQHNFSEVVGNSAVLRESLRNVERVAPTDSTVLIVGETGSGKELFARAVHGRSRRRTRPLVKVNCGAIPPGLVESELFGHVKGAFTGALEKRVGRFELADGGTILLDEVSELPLDAQVKLLRVLQEQEFDPVGSSRTVRVDVRVIAATNRDLQQAVREGRFREDLLYRLNVFPIRVPALRERASDIPLLAGFFVSGLSRKLGKPLKGFDARSMDRLMRYTWPGNVRELQNVVERAAILADGPVLEIEAGFSEAAQRSAPAAPSRDANRLDDVQREHILAVLKATGGIVEGARGAAIILGMHPNTLRSRMKKLGIPSGPPRSS